MRRLPAALTPLLLVLPLLTACGSDDPGPDPATASEDDFTGGTCLVLAQDVIAMRTFAAQTLQRHPDGSLELGDERTLSGSVARLRQGEGRAGSALLDPLTDLVNAIQEVLDRVDANRYDGPQYLERVRDDADRVIRVCT